MRATLLAACAVAAARGQQPALLPEALAVTGAGKTKPDSKPRLATLDEINKIYEEGHPSNDLSGPGAAGLVVHMHDLTEQKQFLPGVHYAAADTVDDVPDVIRELQRDPEYARSLAQRGFERMLQMDTAEVTRYCSRGAFQDMSMTRPRRVPR